MSHHGTPEARKILAWLLAERGILSPELSDPTVDMSGRVVGIEVVEVVLGERLLGTLPHEVSHPGDEDVAERVGIDGVNIGFILGFFGLLGDTGLEVNVIKVLVGGLELRLGVGRVDGLGGNGGGR